MNDSKKKAFEDSLEETIIPDSLTNSQLPFESPRYEEALKRSKNKTPQTPPLDELEMVPSSPHTVGEGETEWEPNEWEKKQKKSHQFQVIWDENDLENPKNFSTFKKWAITLILSISVLCVSFASSAYTGAFRSVVRTFGVPNEVGILGITFFVLGFAFGPLLWAPLTELFGRNPPFYTSYLLFTIFHLPCAFAQNIETVLISRLIGGISGSCPLATCGAVLADIWDPHERGKPMAFFCLCPVLGSVFGPVIAGYIEEHLPWPWHFYIMFIFSFVALILSLIIPETYAPILLTRRAILYRQTFKDDRYTSAFEEKKLTIARQLKVALTRPFLLIIREPMLLCLSLYMAYAYGILYLCFAEFPLVFQFARQWSPGLAGFSFMGIAVGTVIAVFVGNPIQDHLYHKAMDPETKIAPPEARLISSIGGGISIAVGLWWFAWTALPPIHWILPIIGTVWFGMGIVVMWLGIMNYIVDTYVIYAASAIAASSFLRYLAGALFPLFALQLFEKLGIPVGTSVLAAIATVAIPIPIVFYKYGAILRKKSKFAFD